MPADMSIRVKRAYEPASPDDGTRVLVDRLWPRGLKRADSAIDHWLKDVAPSTELRHWFGHSPERWDEFHRRYEEELRQRPDQLATLRELADRGPMTLLFSARDEAHNNAVALRDVLLGRAEV